MAISENKPIAVGKCSYIKCGAPIKYRVTHGGLVFFTCRAETGLVSCRRHEKMGRQESTEFIENLETLKGKTANDNRDTTGRDSANDNKPAEQPKRAANGWAVEF